MAWALGLHGSPFNLVLSLCGCVASAARSSLSFSFLICQLCCLEGYKQHTGVVYIRPSKPVQCSRCYYFYYYTNSLTLSVSGCEVGTMRPNQPLWGMNKARPLIGVPTTPAAVLLLSSRSQHRAPLRSHGDLHSEPGLPQGLYIANFI